MDQSGSSDVPEPDMPTPGTSPVPETEPPRQTPPAPRPAAPPTVHIVNRPMGFGRLVVATLTSLSVLGLVFIVGIGAGMLLIGIMGFWVAGTGMDQWILRDSYREGGGRTVAVIPVRGVIDERQAEVVRRCVDNVLADSSVRAVVLRVESGGGAMSPSDQIWHELGRLSADGLPVVASFGGVAASGGYYIACDADYIMAEETCITGSIGVIAQIMTFQGLMDKIGVEPVTLVSTDSPEKDVANDIFSEWTEEDRQTVRMMLNAAYELFHQRVQTGRGTVITDPGRLKAIADGSIFTASQALDNGLVDGIGYLDDAIAQAERLANLTTGSATVEVLLQRPTLLGGLPLVRAEPMAGRDLLDPERIRSLVNELSRVRIMYLMR